jgi:hypothetical protein
MLTPGDTLTGGSAVAQHILDDAGYGNTADETVLVQSASHTVHDPQFRNTLEATVGAVSSQRWIADVRSPLGHGGATLASRDGHSALVQFNVRGDRMQTMDRIVPVRECPRSLCNKELADSGGRLAGVRGDTAQQVADGSAHLEAAEPEAKAFALFALLEHVDRSRP